MILFKTMGSLVMTAGLVSAAVHVIKVGEANKHKFDPEEVEAEVGDTLQFVMYPPMHSVVRAEYEHPCQPLNYGNRDHSEADAWWSGFFEVPDNAQTKELPVWEKKINNTDQIWVYCSQYLACTDTKMAGVIWVNGNHTDRNGKNRTFAQHISKAKELAYELSPGDSSIPEGATSPPPKLPKETGASIHEHSHDEKKEDSKLGAGAIAGIAVGAVAGVVLVAVLIYLFGRNKSLSETLRYSRPPAGKIAPLPAMSVGPNSPYSPSFPATPAPGYEGEMKSANAMAAPVPGYNQHDNNFNAHQSWMSQTSTMRTQSPDNMTERGYYNGGMMSPNAFSPHNSYMAPPPQQQQQQQQSYHLQSSPTETPWSPGGYSWQNTQPQHEMSAGQEGVAQQRQSGMNNGYVTRSHVAAPVELAGETSENVVSAAPPIYVSSLTERGEQVRDPVDKTPAVTTRDT